MNPIVVWTVCIESPSSEEVKKYHLLGVFSTLEGALVRVKRSVYAERIVIERRNVEETLASSWRDR